jgi:very-short-patch-repair endonuclease
MENRDDSLNRARQLRRKMTDAERLLWSVLRNRRFAHFKFRRQVPIGSFIVDFVCFDRRLILELDGGQHKRQAQYDAERTRWLEEQGFRVVRIWNHEFFQDRDAVEELLFRRLHEPGKAEENSPSPCPLPRGEREECAGDHA